MAATGSSETNENNATGYEFPFAREEWVGAFEEIRPLIMAEWPELDAKAVDATDGDPDELVTVVTEATQHSKTLVRRHLTEIAEVAGIDATSLENKLVRLLHILEGKAGPVQDHVRNTRDRANQTLQEWSAEGQYIVDEVRQTVPKAEEKIKDNIWTTLLGTLGIGLLVGLVVGLTHRGR